MSAVPISAAEILARTGEALIRHHCAFKFARTIDRVAELVSTHHDRTGAGKFITAYPDNDEHFALVAQELDWATDGFPGPEILSDRPYRLQSLVHYRYGAFAGVPVLTNDGDYESMLVAPDGSLEKDERGVCFSPPRWTTPPPSPGARTVQPILTAPNEVLLGSRFVVSKAIRHANRGGVYRGFDRTTTLPVVIKQARPHIGSTLFGSDVCDALRHEANLLDRFSQLGIAPRKIALFEQQKNVFLAEELIEGTTLRTWVLQRVDRANGLAGADALGAITKLVDLLVSVHGEGYVCRDLNPDNVMVDHRGQLRLIDLELLAQPHEHVVSAFTVGYGAPEQVAVWLELISADYSIAWRLTPLILGLMDDEPNLRWNLRRVRAFLTDQRLTAENCGAVSTRQQTRLSFDHQRRLISDGLAYLLKTMTRQPAPHAGMWKPADNHMNSDPCNVQHGAAGVLAVLTRASQTLKETGLIDAVRAVAHWIDQRWPAEQRILPGLYFGRSGTAWALYDAARTIGDDELADRAVQLAKRVPVLWPNPDICHGAAGAGMTQLYLLHMTGDPSFRDRARQCADGLVSAAERHARGVVWRIPVGFESELAGLAHYGFAHGIAGVGSFLLAAGLALNRLDYIDVARAAGATLREAAEVSDEAAWWPSGENEPNESSRLTHWCSGSSGVGAFLIRLWLATGDQETCELTKKAAVAVRRNKWHSSPIACHGLAGDGEFLLDLADAVGERCYRGWAEELASCIFVRSTLRDGKLLTPDESNMDVTPEYGTGLAGVLGFFLRLCHGGSRLWMADAWNALSN